MKSRLNVLIPTMCAFALMAGSLFADEFQELMAAASRAERQGEFVRAIVTFNSALLQALTPDRQAMVYLNRGGAYAFNGEMDRAISDWDESIRLNPGLADAYNNRATGYYQKGDYKKALADYQQAATLAPALGLNGLAWVLATCPDASVRDGKTAIEVAGKACDLSNWKDWRFIDTLAATHAEAGDFAHAIEYAKQARNMPGLTEAQRNEVISHLESYEKKTPFHEKPKP